MSELDTLTCATEVDRVLANDVATADGVYADLFSGACADEALTAMHDLFVVERIGILEDFDQSLRSAAGRIFFMMVVHFEHFRLVLFAEDVGGFTG